MTVINGHSNHICQDAPPIDDAELAAKINAALEAAYAANAKKNEAEDTAGKLLFEAHKLHPGRKDFEEFLKLTDCFSYSYAMMLIKSVTDPAEFQELKADNAARQKKHRAKQRALLAKAKKMQAEELPVPLPGMATGEPEPPAVRYVTDTAPVGAEKPTVPSAEAKAPQSAHHPNLSDEFAIAIKMLMKLVTKPSDKFVGAISAGDLETIANFLMQVVTKSKPVVSLAVASEMEGDCLDIPSFLLCTAEATS